MSEGRATTLVGHLIDEHYAFTTEETLTACSISIEMLTSLVDEGVVEPAGSEAETWTFDGCAVARAVKAVRLQRELEIDLPAIAVVLDLMQEIESLQRRLRDSE